MEKRVLFFFALVTLSFFFIQNYFTPSKNVSKSSEITYHEEKGIEFTPLYPDEKRSKLPIYGIPYGSSFFVFGEDLPQTLYSKSHVLHKMVSSKHSLSIYNSSKQPLFLPTPPESVDVHLLSIGREGMIETTKASFKKNKISELPENHSFSLCLYKSGNNYFPLGVYESGELIPLDKFSDFESTFQEIASQSEIYAPNENFYVIETPYQQLVFSNVGGSLSEINLPFAPPSVVKKIKYDKVMESKHPENDYFPQFSSRFADPKLQRELGGFYPLLRRDILTKSGNIQSAIDPRYYSLNIIGDGVENIPYKLSRMEKDLVEFTLTQPHRRITKTYYFPQDVEKSPYVFNVRIQVEGDARNLWLTSGVPEVELISGSFTPSLKYSYLKGNRGQIENIKLPKDPIYASNISPNWIVNSNGFFGIIMDPLDSLPPGYKAEKIPGEQVPTKLTLIDAQYDKYPAKKYPGYEVLLPLSNQTLEFRVFAGPFEDDILSTLDRTYSDPATGYSPDYSSAQSLHGYFSFITAPFAKFMFFIMKIFHSLTGSWALSIILITVVLRLMLYPLNSWSIKTQAKSQLLQPKLKALQERYKKDPKRLQMETMKLYKESGVNPFMGCFPLLIQMPFLFAMFNLLKSAFELRGATFIPGWIDSLTSPDVLFSWNYPIIFLGNSFHLLPVLLGAVMYFQQRYTLRASGADMSKLTEQQRQQVATGNIMVVVFTVLFYHLPSGLNLYWLFSSLLGIAQQHWLRLKGKHPSMVNNPKK